MRQRDQPLHVVLLAEKRDVAVQLQLMRQMLGGAAVRPVARHQQVRGDVLANFGEDADAVRDALHGPEVGKVNQQLLPGRGIRRGAGLLVIGMVEIAVDEVGDDADLVRYSKNLDRLPPQVLADRADAVRALDGKLGDRKVGGVGAHQRDIRPVQRGDEGQAALRGQHLLRQQRGDGMGDGVVDVQQVEPVGLGHVGHARRQRQAVRRILEERVGGDLHFVVMNARNTGVEANRVGVADEVDFVAAAGEFHPQFRRDDAAAAVGGITGDADVHWASWKSSCGIVMAAEP